ncbi:hypothetical protein B0H34DRAFT_518088 [Crassisporium funariophilum]|nr:hypothetical protein B0H34DRAFT_518088 [Crassisporium funariophilum]
MIHSDSLEAEYPFQDEVTLPYTLQLFTELQELHISAFHHLWRVPPALDAALCSVFALTSLENLSYYGILNFPINRYSQHFTFLKHLGIDETSLNISSGTDFVSHPSPNTPTGASGELFKLQKLTLYSPPAGSPLKFRALGLDISQLLRFGFSISGGSEDEVLAAWDVASAASRTLTHLTWSFGFCKPCLLSAFGHIE